MLFKLIIDKEKEESVVATVHEASALTEQLQALVAGTECGDELTGYTEEDTVILKIGGIECIWVEDGRTYAIYEDGVRYRLRGRLYEVEAKLGSEFVRINKSALGNWSRIRRFKASIAGAVDVEFKGGHVEYVSRRCFAELKRRFDL